MLVRRGVINYNRSNRKALSTIVSTLLILLLVFVAIGILWVVIKNVVMQGTEQISLGKFTLDLAIDRVQISPTNNSVSVSVVRNPGEGDFVAMKFIVSDGQNSEVFTSNGSLDVYQKEKFTFDLQTINKSRIQKIEVVPVFRLKSGKEVAGDVKDTWENPGSLSYSGESTCTPYCPSGAECGSDGCGGTCGTTLCSGSTPNCVNYQCTADTCTPSCTNKECGSDGCGGTCGSCSLTNSNSQCSSTFQCEIVSCSTGFADCDSTDSNGCEINLQTDNNNCGTCGNVCSSTQTCVSGTCTAQTVPDTCTSLNYECGTVNGESCGTCATGETCSSGTCIAQTTTPPSGTCQSSGYECGTFNGESCGTCGSGETCYIGICIAQTATSDYSNSVYIDPTAPSGGSGTLASPLNTIPTIQSDTVYFFKAGTSVTIADIKISDKHHVKLTTYGGTQRFKINGNGNDKTKTFGVSGSDIIIENMEVDGNGEQCPYLSMYVPTNVYAQIPAEDITIKNSKFYDFASGIRAFGAVNLTVVGTEIYDIGEDGAFITNCDGIRFINNYIHDVNQGFFTQAAGTTAAGDGIQLEPVANWKVMGNKIDRSGTGNKFAFIANNQDRPGIKILRNNTLIGPYDADQGGAIVYITGMADIVDISDNIFVMSDPANPVSGIFQKVDNANIHNNMFVNVGSSFLSNDAVFVDNEACGIAMSIDSYYPWSGTEATYIGACPSSYLSL